MNQFENCLFYLGGGYLYLMLKFVSGFGTTKNGKTKGRRKLQGLNIERKEKN